ncbi:MAG TPA: hypothetical protein VNZ22_17015, partial [Bacillota bacterium]|nr:hypothetical protein [Bacillota bacterium]
MKLASVCLGTFALGAATLLATPGLFHRWGTDILHVFSYKAMTNEGVRTNAVGYVSLSQRQQGQVDVQTLGMIVRGLETNASYRLFAIVNNDTNLTPVADINADALGRVRLAYRQVEHSNGKINPVGRGWQALPASLDPVSLVR